MRVIKRYANRKLYDTTGRQYVTLTFIAELISKGETVQVIDARTGADVTKMALSKIVLEQGQKDANALPTSFLTDMIKKSGATLMDYIRKPWETAVGTANWAQGEVDKSVQGLVKMGRLSLSEAETLTKDIVGRVQNQLSVQEHALHGRIQKGIETAMHTVNLPTRGDVEEIRHKLDRIEGRVDKLLSHKRK